MNAIQASERYRYVHIFAAHLSPTRTHIPLYSSWFEMRLADGVPLIAFRRTVQRSPSHTHQHTHTHHLGIAVLLPPPPPPERAISLIHGKYMESYHHSPGLLGGARSTCAECLFATTHKKKTRCINIFTHPENRGAHTHTHHSTSSPLVRSLR